MITRNIAFCNLCRNAINVVLRPGCLPQVHAYELIVADLHVMTIPRSYGLLSVVSEVSLSVQLWGYSNQRLQEAIEEQTRVVAVRHYPSSTRSHASHGKRPRDAYACGRAVLDDGLSVFHAFHAGRCN